MKGEARRTAFAARKAAHAAGQGDAAARLADFLRPHAGKVLAGYMPIRTEIDPLPAMAAHQGQVGVPVIDAPGLPLGFRLWTPDTHMVEGPYGAAVPEGGPWVTPDVLILPMVAFDRRGFRLGYGGGFYDRTLERLRGLQPVLAVGFAFSAQELPEVPIEPVDQPMDALVTEAFTLVF